MVYGQQDYSTKWGLEGKAKGTLHCNCKEVVEEAEGLQRTAGERVSLDRAICRSPAE